MKKILIAVALLLLSHSTGTNAAGCEIDQVVSYHEYGHTFMDGTATCDGIMSASFYNKDGKLLAAQKASIDGGIFSFIINTTAIATYKYTIREM